MKPGKAANQNGDTTKAIRKAKVLENIKLEIDLKKEKKVPICNVCSKTFRDNYNLKKHVQQKICQRSQIKCEHCRKQFFKDLEDTSHMNKGTCLECQQKRHAGEKLHTCKVCEKVFYLKSKLQGHAKVHVGEKSYTCTECGKLFTSKTNLMSHKKSHGDKESYECTKCEKAFKRERILRNHIEKQNCNTNVGCPEYNEGLKTVWMSEVGCPCPECMQIFETVELLTEHLKVH